ncbi:hypothetical protein HH308_16870 [Gordonia sp. TBRC 11910]|uniref:Alpha/beta hydrolase family protein n=1 Tax=Gordonia asplenii TaxID=2725283 RepID=A0A848KXQ0_9ACTN|nr:hypothetical protein [Gordonia asplenii]NMO02887.1 hypothetical protein [Gordonia asplenii]
MTELAADPTVSAPIFFGPADRSLFGVLSTPQAAAVRGGVVVCPSLGKEQAETTRWLKLFAERLAARGFAVLRFDYPNTGESAGAQDAPDAAHNWTEGIGQAIDYLRSGGAEQIVVVGHRAGALLASQVIAGSGVRYAVAWDPIRKGRQYLRTKTVLYNMVSEYSDDVAARVPASAIAASTVDERIHSAGQTLHADAASELRSLTLDPGAFDGVRTLLLSGDDGLVTSFGDVGADVVRIDDQESYLAPNHPALLDFPLTDIGVVVDWIDGAIGPERTPFDVERRTSAVVAHADDGRPITTDVYRTSAGIMVWDTAIGDRHDVGKVFVAHSLGQYVRTGPSRLWFEIAVAVAARGGRAIRFDRMGVGESGVADAADGRLALYTHDYVDDGLGVLADLRPRAGARIVHAGICVGSWMAAHGARRTAQLPGVKSSVVLVNPLMWRLRPQRRFRVTDYGSDVAVAGTGRTDEVDTSFRGRLRRKLIWVGGRSARRVRRLPRRWWSIVGRIPAMSVPDSFFAEFDAAGVDVHVAFAPGDYVYFDDASGAADAVAAAGDHVHVVVSAAGDHTSYHAAMRQVVGDTVLRAFEG